MKNAATLLLIVLTTIFTIQCKSDDDMDTEQGNELNGAYHLTKIAGCVSAQNLEYEPGWVVWTFNEVDQTLNVQNNVWTTGPEQICAGLSSETYAYEIIVENGVSRLFTDGRDFGIITNTATGLILDGSDIDNGSVRTFIK